MAMFVFVPVSAAFAISRILPYSIWGSRHLLIVFAPAAVLIALFLTEIRQRISRIVIDTTVAFIAVAAFGVSLAAARPQFVWCSWDAAASRAASAGAASIYAFEDIVAYQIWFATRNAVPRPKIARITGIEKIAEDKAYFLPRGFDAVRRLSVGEISENDITVIFRANSINSSEPPLRNLLQAGFEIAKIDEYDAAGQKSFAVRLIRRK